jgi:hypothetical protein
MIAKQLSSLADALSAGIVLGARVPIALTGPGDDRLSWVASAALVQVTALMTPKMTQTTYASEGQIGSRLPEG